MTSFHFVQREVLQSTNWVEKGHWFLMLTSCSPFYKTCSTIWNVDRSPAITGDGWLLFWECVRYEMSCTNQHDVLMCGSGICHYDVKWCHSLVHVIDGSLQVLLKMKWHDWVVLHVTCIAPVISCFPTAKHVKCICHQVQFILFVKSKKCLSLNWKWNNSIRIH